MLIQLPNGSPERQGGRGEGVDAFEAGLRRDLATPQIVSYDAMLGGWPKRALDLFLALFTLPLWAPVLLAAAAWAKLRHRAAVFHAAERIGYGGRAFRCFWLRVTPPVATVEQVQVADTPADDPANAWTLITNQAEGRRAKWRRLFERLPQMFNVIAGDMALVGPSPLTREELEPLKTARRYYLSARPGIIGVSAMLDSSAEESSQYKLYALSWAFSTDALIFWDAVRSLRDRGELWRPGLKLPAAGNRAPKVIVRRRGGSAD